MSNIRNYTPEQREKIQKQIHLEVDRSFDVNKFGKGSPAWMGLLFMLKRFNRGNYYGTFEWKVLGTSANDVKEKEVTHKLQEIFDEP